MVKNLDDEYLSILEDVYFQPIFIMGIQRSGTSILYKMLSSTNFFNTVNAYHIIKYDELIYNKINKIEKKEKNKLDEFFKNKSQLNRGIDKLQINSNFAEEYGFILGNRTNDSKLKSESLPIFIQLCKKIQYLSKNNKPILLKNPFDFTNFKYINQVFPDAQMIFIHRNPIKTLNSQLKALRTLLKNKSEYMALLSSSYKKLYQNRFSLGYTRFLHRYLKPYIISKQINRLVDATNSYIENIKSIDYKTYINLRYEDLCENPNDEIYKVLNFLNLKPKKNIRFNEYIKTRKTTNLSELEKRKNYIYKKMKPYYNLFNYSINEY
jgi:hypothetical protein